MRRCNCAGQSQCPLEPGTEGWKDKRYPNGDLMFQQLKQPVELPEEGMMAGDAVGTDGEGRVWVLARALDPDRLVKYTKAKMGRRCRFGRK